MSFLTTTRSLLLRGLVLMVVLVTAACSSGEATVTATDATDGSASSATTTTDEPATSTASDGDTSSASDESASAAASGENWTGPAWLTFPDGFTLTWGENFVGDNDAFVQGEIGSLSGEAAVAHMRGVLTSNGYDLIRDTPSWVVGVNGANEFVTAGVGTGQPPMLSVYFLTERNAELQGFTQTLDVLNVDLDDGAPFDVPGTCSEGGQGFSSSDGATTISISGEYPDYSIFMTITTPEGVAWSGLGGAPSAIADVGFFMISTVVNDNGETAEAYLDVDCVVGG